MSTLDLSGAELSNHVPAGSYNCTVFAAEMQETQGGEGSKLPKGTPKINVQFRISDGPHENKRFFASYVIPPADYEKAPQLKGMLVRFLKGLGYDQKKLTSGKFNLDLEDMAGRECVVTVKVKPKYGSDPEDNEFTNEVTGIKPAGSSTGAGSTLI